MSQEVNKKELKDLVHVFVTKSHVAISQLSCSNKSEET